MKDANHVATCLARHGAKADYLHRQRGGVKWSDVVRQQAPGNTQRLQAKRNKNDDLPQQPQSRIGSTSSLSSIVWLPSLTKLCFPSAASCSMCLSSKNPMISFDDTLMYLTYHYARTPKSLPCHVYHLKGRLTLRASYMMQLSLLAA